MQKLKILLPLFLLFSLGLLVPADARAQSGTRLYLPEIHKPNPPHWIGPDGGSVVCLAADPTDPDQSPDMKTVYAGTLSSGVYKSMDGGITWKSATAGIASTFIDSLAVDPVNGSIVYAGTHGNGVYKSTNGGESWFPINNGIALKSVVYTVAVNPGNHNLVYAGTRIEGTKYTGILYKSTNGGNSWSKVMEFSDDWIYSVAIDPSAPNTVLAAIHTRGPVVSYDYGNKHTWNDGYPPILDSYLSGRWLKGRAVAFDPRGWMDRAYYSAWHDGMIGYSSDGGASWLLSGGSLGSSHIYPNGISVKPDRPDVVYLAAHESNVAGVLRSDNAGKSWHGAGLSGKTIYSVTALSGGGDTLLAGTFMDGLHRSTNGGSSWNYSMSGIHDSKVTGMVFSGGDKIFASTQSGGGVFQSTDDGVTWARFANNLGDNNINGLALHPTNPNILFALTQNAGLKRIDLTSGSSWTSSAAAALSSDPTELDETSPLGPPSAPDDVMAELPDEETFDFAAPWRSNAASASAPVLSIAFAPTNANIAYFGTNGGGVYSSGDGGASWSYAGQPGGIVRGLAVSPGNTRLVYAATNRAGILRASSDGGLTWYDIALPSSGLSLYAVVIWPSDPESVYAGTSSGVYRYNAGSWQMVGLSDVTVYQLGFNPGAPERLIAGTDRGGFRYFNDGLNWSSIAGEMEGRRVVSLSFNPADRTSVFLGSDGHGTLEVHLP